VTVEPEPWERARLAFLARGLAVDAALEVQLTDGEWSYDPALHRVLVPRGALAAWGPQRCLGALTQHVAARLISRMHLLRFEFPDPRLGAELAHACEVPRLRSYAGTRFPGGEPWLAEHAAAERQEVAARPLKDLPKFAQFCAVVRCEEADRSADHALERAVAPAVRRALWLTQPVRRVIPLEVPPTRPSPDVDEEALAREMLARRRWLRDTPAFVDPYEVGVLVSALRVVERIEARIAPVARRLLDDDLGRMSVQQVLDACTLGRVSPSAGSVTGADWYATRAQELRRHARRLMLSTLSVAALRSGIVRHEDAASLDTRLNGLVPGVERVLRTALAHGRPRALEGGRARGSRLHLPSAMAAAWDMARRTRVWGRRARPSGTNAAVLLLADLSGSMFGERVRAGRDVIWVLATALTRLRVPFAVYGFQDRLIPFLPFGASWDRGARAALAQMELEVFGQRPGGHNRPENNDDGPCLRAAADLLLRQPARDRLLIVASDGQPHGVNSSEAELRAVVAELEDAPLRLIGLGVGPDTDAVLGFYPRARAGIGADVVGHALSELLCQTVSRTPPGRSP
jgi:hypothetical protein